jgi:hypothetical protein
MLYLARQLAKHNDLFGLPENHSSGVDENRRSTFACCDAEQKILIEAGFASLYAVVPHPYPPWRSVRKIHEQPGEDATTASIGLQIGPQL